MTAEILINHAIPCLKLTDAVKWALEQFNHSKCTYLPVVTGDKYLGMLSEDLILDENPNKKISSIKLLFQDITVHQHQHYFDILRIFNKLHINVIAVVDNNKQYIGTVNAEAILIHFAGAGFVNHPGSILVLCVPQNNYSPAEILRIVESNEHKALFLYVSDVVDDAMNVHVTLKINKTDLTRLISAFERYGYTIAAAFHESLIKDVATERLNLLLKYLSI